MRCEIEYGRQRISFTLAFTGLRNLSITVEPNRSVHVIAPPGADVETVRRRVGKRARWILAQQRRFALLLPTPPSRLHRTGESIRYLGRQYRLRIRLADEGNDEKVVLSKLGIEVAVLASSPPNCATSLLDHWFATRASTTLEKRFRQCAAMVEPTGIVPKGYSIRRMPKRWGSCTAKGRILLNPDLVHAPTPCIDYVILHELCHLAEHGHTPAFYRLLTRILPDWPQRKARLERCSL